MPREGAGAGADRGIIEQSSLAQTCQPDQRVTAHEIEINMHTDGKKPSLTDSELSPRATLEAKKAKWGRTAASFLPATLVYPVWVYTMSAGGLWYDVFSEYYTMTIWDGPG